MNSKFIVVAAVAAVLFGCKEPPKDTAYYLKHKEEAQKVLVECEKGALSGDDCKNAREAIDELDRQDFFKKSLGR
ncbi:EexN family lipoprotein [Plesiomonas sp. PI-19]|uniref:EexN family lipoprotein n=1 Tax=Plesiomonas sp. PI-19 TaxID=2898798 RepID=UPI001F48A68C|nr:EexN family lipoprotein [Plesiomonas sp. PI-19]MCE5165615.1 EexN family lipoprotein [Plesiomonas sp. PI-19]